MQAVSIGGVLLGADLPKICASLIGNTIDAIHTELSSSSVDAVDLFEWRFDLQSDQNHTAMANNLVSLKTLIKKTPLIFTLRTNREGGEVDYSDEAYHELYKAVISTGLVDAIDLEGTRPDPVLTDLIALAKTKQIKTLLSYHNFEKTPENDLLQAFADKASTLDADIIKIAVMPTSTSDVLRFMSFSQQLANTQNKPIITMSMAQLGIISRFGCVLTGSAMTFGVLKQASAPGQLPVSQLRELLKLTQI